MNKLDYNGSRQQWEGGMESEDELLHISMSDATFEKHLKQYLERIGVPTLTYVELLACVDQVFEQRYRAAQHLRCLDYWRTCDDPNVRIYRRQRRYQPET